MKKRILSAVLALCLAISMLSANAFADNGARWVTKTEPAGTGSITETLYPGTMVFNSTPGVESYNIQVKKNGEVFLETNWLFDQLETVQPVWADNMCWEVLESGKYSFVATSDSGVICAESGEWNYVKPSKSLSAPTGVKWVDGTPVWNAVPGARGYIVQWYRADRADYEPRPVSIVVVDGAQLPDGDGGIFERHGDGYYWVQVRALSDDITVTCNSQWSEMSTEYLVGGAPTGSAPMKQTNFRFLYQSSVSGEMETYNFDYDETWFTKSSMSFNIDLARASQCFTMAGFGGDGKTYADRAITIKSLFTRLKFNFTDASVNYPDPTQNTIGYAIGSKRISTGSEEFTLIAAVVRGAGYEEEWANNFTVGTGDEHQGFAHAADTVYAAVRKYIADNNITGNIKIWTTSFSRGAATANILGQRLNTAASTGAIPGLKAEGIYAYCFECPRTVRSTASSYKTQYKNIFNIVNYSDVVTKVPMEKWSYQRYGTTYYLPSGELKYNNMKQAKDTMLSWYADILQEFEFNTSPILKAKLLSAQMLYQGDFTDRLANGMASVFKSPAYYTQNVQSTMEQTLLSLNDDQYTVDEVLIAAVGVAAVLAPTDILLKMGVGAAAVSIGHAHYPELCLSWLNTVNGKSIGFSEPRTRRLVVNCPVDVSVYDSSGTLVAKVVDDKFVDIPDSTIGGYLDENGQKRFILPCDEEFRVEIEATDEGKMSYLVEEANVDTGLNERIVGYYDIPISDGDEFTGIVDDIDGVEKGEYPLTDGEGEKLTPSVDKTSGIGTFTVTAEAGKGGSVYGGGSFNEGEFALVTAEPDKGYRFVGWYDANGHMRSEDAEYRFRVESDVKLTARFADGSSVLKFNTNGGSAIKDVTGDIGALVDLRAYVPVRSGYEFAGWFADAGLKTPVSTVKLGEIQAVYAKWIWKCPFNDVTAEDWFFGDVQCVFEKGLMTGTSGSTFSPHMTVTRGMIATVLYRMEGEPKVSAETKFTDVGKDQYYAKAVAWAESTGLVKGYGDGRFGPLDQITREQLAAILYRYAGYKGYDRSAVNDLTLFTDKPSPWAADAVGWAVGSGFISGRGGGILDPQGSARRCETAAILHRFLDVYAK